MTCTASRSRRPPWALAPERPGLEAGSQDREALLGSRRRSASGSWSASTRKRRSRRSREPAEGPRRSRPPATARLPPSARTLPRAPAPGVPTRAGLPLPGRASRGLRLGEDIVAVVPHGDQPQIGNWREDRRPRADDDRLGSGQDGQVRLVALAVRGLTGHHSDHAGSTSSVHAACRARTSRASGTTSTAARPRAAAFTAAAANIANGSSRG